MDMELKFGDVLLVKNRDNIISKIIQKVTNSKYSHIALVLNQYEIVEINWYYSLKIRHITYSKSMYDIYRFKDLTDKNKQDMYEFILESINTKYDYLQTFGHLFNKLFGLKIINNPYLYNCSEFVDKIFMYTGIDLLPKESEGTITPGDIAKSEKLIKIK